MFIYLVILKYLIYNQEPLDRQISMKKLHYLQTVSIKSNIYLLRLHHFYSKLVSSFKMFFVKFYLFCFHSYHH